MAVRHLREYYAKLSKQRAEMLCALKEIEKEYNDGMIPPERVENVKRMIAPVESSYKSLAWVMYLLNQPNRDSKKEAYRKMQKKALSIMDDNYSPESTVKKNEETIDNLKNS